MQIQNSKKVKKLQNLAIRVMYFSTYDIPSKPLFKKSTILKLKDQLSLVNCLLIHDQSRNLLHSSFQNFLLPCTDLHDTNTQSHARSIFVPHVNPKQQGHSSIGVSSILKGKPSVSSTKPKSTLSY